jgi:hemerythrin-like metal-binding protein
MDNQLVWKDEYSVNVKEIDEQHKGLFTIINSLIKENDSLSASEDHVKEIIGEIVAYKTNHFCTEENYFKKFNFEGAEEHITAHKTFETKVGEIQKQHEGDVMGFSYALVDFLEDWLVGHLMHMDKKYTQCFNANGLV